MAEITIKQHLFEQEHLQAIVATLKAQGWAAEQLCEDRITWAFDASDIARFRQAYEQVLEETEGPRSSPAKIQEQVLELYPGLDRLIQAAVEGLYRAILFGYRLEQKTGTPSATGGSLRRDGLRIGLENYADLLDDVGGLFLFAADDAAYDELIRAAGGLDQVSRCEVCGSFVDVDCRCSGAIA